MRDDVASFARDELTPGAEARDRDSAFSSDLWRRCGTIQLQGLVIPTEYGGRGLDPVSAAIALEGLGFGCEDGGLAFALCAHMLACCVPVWKHGSEEMKRAWLPGLCDGSLIAANAMTEPSSGSDALSLETKAVRTGAGFRLSGHKTFVSNAPVAHVIIAYAAMPGSDDAPAEVTAFLIPRETPGVRIGDRMEKMSLRTCQMSDVRFEDAELPADSIIGQPGGGAQIFAESMDWERSLLGALHVGAMERILDRAVAFARARRAGGESIGRLQAVSHRIADMKIRLEAARLLTREAARSLNSRRSSGLPAAISKVFASEALVKSATDAVRTMGGAGILVGSGVERTLRDAVAATLYSGTNDIQRNIIARWLGL